MKTLLEDSNQTWIKLPGGQPPRSAFGHIFGAQVPISWKLGITSPPDDLDSIIERLSEKVQLGENIGGTGNISQQAYQRGMACLHRFKLLMRQYPLEKYWALGTITFRVADNSEDFVRAAKKIGIDISIISGVQEAILIYAGVISALPVSDYHRQKQVTRILLPHR